MTVTSPHTRRRTDALPPSATVRRLAGGHGRGATGVRPPPPAAGRLVPLGRAGLAGRVAGPPRGDPRALAALAARRDAARPGGPVRRGGGPRRRAPAAAAPGRPHRARCCRCRLLLPAGTDGPVPVLLTQTRHERWGRAAPGARLGRRARLRLRGRRRHGRRGRGGRRRRLVRPGAPGVGAQPRAGRPARRRGGRRDAGRRRRSRGGRQGRARGGRPRRALRRPSSRAAPACSARSPPASARSATRRGRRATHAPPPGLVPSAPALLRRPRGPAADRRARAAGLHRAAAAAAVGRPARRGREHRRGRADGAAVRPTWELLGAPGALTLRWRDGGHAADEATLEAHLDWADHAVLGRGARRARARGPARRRVAPVAVVARGAAARAGGRAGRAWTRRSIARGLGVRGSEPSRPRPGRPARPDPPGRRCASRRAAARRRRAGRGGDGRRGRRRRPPARRGPRGRRPAPLVLWLPPLCRAAGYRGGDADDGPLYLDLARDGFAVACHDPLGAGSRLAEGAAFAARHPRWSPLGRMVADAQAVLEAAGALPGVDGGRVLVAGYGTGALVAAHLLALCPGRDRRRARGPVGRRAAVAPRLRGAARGPGRPPRHRRRPPRGRAVPARGGRPARDRGRCSGRGRRARGARRPPPPRPRHAPAVRAWLRDASADRARRAA